MRALRPEELDIVAGGAGDTSSKAPIYVTGTRPPTILPPTVGGDNPGGGGFGPGGGVIEPPPDDCGGAPSTDWADDPDVQAALHTAGADDAGVDRAIDNWDTIVDAANAAGIDPALLAAIAMRETDFRNIDEGGGGLGRGVFQIDLGAHPDVTEAQAENLTFAANYAANILATNMATLANEFPNFTHDQLLQATAASYNFGVDDISGNPATIDVGTTGGNYGSNVLDLMDAFKDPDTGMTPGAGANNGGC
jgi:hypothetical protein